MTATDDQREHARLLLEALLAVLVAAPDALDVHDRLMLHGLKMLTSGPRRRAASRPTDRIQSAATDGDFHCCRRSPNLRSRNQLPSAMQGPRKVPRETTQHI